MNDFELKTLEESLLSELLWKNHEEIGKNHEENVKNTTNFDIFSGKSDEFSKENDEIEKKLLSFDIYPEFPRKSVKMTEYFENEVKFAKISSIRKAWKKNFFIIILYVKLFINKLKKNVPFSQFSLEEKQLKYINDKAYFVGKAKKTLKKHSKFQKVFP